MKDQGLNVFMYVTVVNTQRCVSTVEMQKFWAHNAEAPTRLQKSTETRTRQGIRMGGVWRGRFQQPPGPSQSSPKFLTPEAEDRCT